MRDVKTVYFGNGDSLRTEALTDLFDQCSEFDLIDGPADCESPSVVLIAAVEGLKQVAAEQCCQFRARFPYCSVIVLAERLTDPDKVEAIEGVADDLLFEPFRFRNLISSLRLQVRNQQWLSSEAAKVGNLTFMPLQRIVRNSSGREVVLSILEARLLYQLIRAKGNLVERSFLLREVWNYHPTADTFTVQTHAHRIRKKLRQLDSDTEFIMTEGDRYAVLAECEPDKATDASS